MKIKSEAVELKKVLSKTTNAKYRQVWLEKKVFPYIEHDPSNEKELCDFFGIKI